jgi:hypothetical protein
VWFGKFFSVVSAHHFRLRVPSPRARGELKFRALVIARSEATKQSRAERQYWIASRSLSSGRALRADPLARNDGAFSRCGCIRVLLTPFPRKPFQKAAFPKRKEAERRRALPVRSPRSLPSLPLRDWIGKQHGAHLVAEARSPFGAPPRLGAEGFTPRLGQGRASWNHRMQTGGPSPAPVQRAPRRPPRGGRADTQTARGAQRMTASREPLRPRPSGVPSRQASLVSRTVAM